MKSLFTLGDLSIGQKETTEGFRSQSHHMKSLNNEVTQDSPKKTTVTAD